MLPRVTGSAHSPVLRVMEVCFPAPACCGESIRKSMTHERREQPRPSVQFIDRLMGDGCIKCKTRSPQVTSWCVRQCVERFAHMSRSGEILRLMHLSKHFMTVGVCAKGQVLFRHLTPQGEWWSRFLWNKKGVSNNIPHITRIKNSIWVQGLKHY